MEVVERQVLAVALVEPRGQAGAREHQVGKARHAAVTDAVAHVHHGLSFVAHPHGVALAAAVAELTQLAAVVREHQGAAIGREDGLVRHHLEVPESQVGHDQVDDRPEPRRHHHQPVAALLGELHEVGKALAHAGSLADERGHLVGCRRGRIDVRSRT